MTRFKSGMNSGDLKIDTFIELHILTDLLERIMDFQIQHYPVSTTQYILMFWLMMRGGHMRPTDISYELLRARHTISGAINGLEKVGLVKRTLDKDDHRSYQINLTKKGWDMIHEIWQERQDTAYQCMSIFDQQKLQQLKDDCVALREHMLNDVTIRGEKASLGLERYWK